jgi:hypothetical protein
MRQEIERAIASLLETPVGNPTAVDCRFAAMGPRHKACDAQTGATDPLCYDFNVRNAQSLLTPVALIEEITLLIAETPKLLGGPKHDCREGNEGLFSHKTS